jgi:hypothetical protein
MFELVEIAENRDFHDRTFPVVLADADIYDPVKRVGYVKYWEQKRTELAEAMKSVDPANLQGIREEIDLYDRIRDKVSGLTSILKDMNTLTPEMHQGSNFSELFEAIEQRLKVNPPEPTPETTQEAETEEVPSPRGSAVSAKNGGIVVGNFQIDGNVSGNIVIGNNNQVNNKE